MIARKIDKLTLPVLGRSPQNVNDTKGNGPYDDRV